MVELIKTIAKILAMGIIVSILVMTPFFVNNFIDLTTITENPDSVLNMYFDHVQPVLVEGKKLLNNFLPANLLNLMLWSAVVKYPIAVIVVGVKTTMQSIGLV